MEYTMFYVCTNCYHTESVDAKFLADKGEPVCIECGGDMKRHDRDELNYGDMEKKKEKRVYMVRIDSCNDINEWDEERIMGESEQDWTIADFISELNSEQIDTENYWYKLI